MKTKAGGFATRVLAVGLGVGAAGGAGCTVENPAYEPPSATCAVGEYFVGQTFTVAAPNKLDILFVVDNSAGMQPAQQALAAAMPTLVDGLNAVAGLDWRLGVTSTDLADQGALVRGGGGREECAGLDAAFVNRDTADPARAAGCAVLIGADGSAFTQGLETARRALDGGATYLRSDARLMLVFFSRRDDCTATAALDRSDPNNCVWQPSALVGAADYARHFASTARPLAGNAVSIVTIVGQPDGRTFAPGVAPSPVCSALGDAYAGSRYASLTTVEPVKRVSLFESFCATSYAPTMSRIVDVAARVSDDELCVSLPMSGDPQAVLLRGGDGSQTALSAAGDYWATGPTEGCANGVVAVAAASHAASDRHEVEVRFCTAQNPAAP